MSNFEKQQSNLAERKAAHREQRKEEGKFCLDLAKLVFGGLILACGYAFVKGEIEINVAAYTLIIGVIIMGVFVALGHKLLNYKS